MDQSIGRFSRTPAKVFAYENAIDVETYQRSLLILRLMRQAFYEKFVVEKNLNDR